jgi:hypothetical protein
MRTWQGAKGKERRTEERTEFRDGTKDHRRQKNIEHPTPNAEYENVAGSERQRREWDNKTTDQR